MDNLPLFKKFITYLQTNNYSDETIYNYTRDLEAFEFFLNKKEIPLQKITTKVINEYKLYLISPERKTAQEKQSTQKLSNFSINRMLSSLHMYLKYLIRSGCESPVLPETIELLKTNRREVKEITLSDQIKLIEAPTQFEKNKTVAIRNRAILEVLFSTGLKISELISLKMTDINKPREILIRQKGVTRTVYLTPRAQKHLNNYLKIRGDSNSPYLFIPYRGKNAQNKEKKISPNYLQDKIKKYRELLSINVPISADYLRHAFATYLAESGASPVAIQILLGHESLDTTTRYVQASDRYAERIFRKYHPLKE